MPPPQKKSFPCLTGIFQRAYIFFILGLGGGFKNPPLLRIESISTWSLIWGNSEQWDTRFEYWLYFLEGFFYHNHYSFVVQYSRIIYHIPLGKNIPDISIPHIHLHVYSISAKTWTYRHCRDILSLSSKDKKFKNLLKNHKFRQWNRLASFCSVFSEARNDPRKNHLVESNFLEQLNK